MKWKFKNYLGQVGKYLIAIVKIEEHLGANKNKNNRIASHSHKTFFKVAQVLTQAITTIFNHHHFCTHENAKKTQKIQNQSAREHDSIYNYFVSQRKSASRPARSRWNYEMNCWVNVRWYLSKKKEMCLAVCELESKRIHNGRWGGMDEKERKHEFAHAQTCVARYIADFSFVLFGTCIHPFYVIRLFANSFYREFLQYFRSLWDVRLSSIHAGNALPHTR